MKISVADPLHFDMDPDHAQLLKNFFSIKNIFLHKIISLIFLKKMYDILMILVDFFLFSMILAHFFVTRIRFRISFHEKDPDRKRNTG